MTVAGLAALIIAAAASLGEPRFDLPHATVAAEVALEESGLDPCVVSRAGDEGLWQVRDSRRRAMHVIAGRASRECIPVVEQARFMVIELRQRPEAAAFFAARSHAVAKRVFVRRYERRRR